MLRIAMLLIVAAISTAQVRSTGAGRNPNFPGSPGFLVQQVDQCAKAQYRP
jgi:hypothetical protein